MNIIATEDSVQQMHSHIRDYVTTILGDKDMDTSGIELVSLLSRVQNSFEAQNVERVQSNELSGARWVILMRLLTDERRGNRNATPTYLSRCQNVSKNTISVLLHGLEEMGLIQRTADPVDKRICHIQLTEAGRSLVETSTPGHLTHLNTLVSDLSPEEKKELITLLEKLYRSLLIHRQIS